MSPTLRFYRRLLLRRAPVMLLLFLATGGGAVFLALSLPTTYISGARMLVESQAISNTLAESTVDIEALEEIELLREQLMTRANLIDIANDHDVFENIRGMNPDEVVSGMLEATDIEASGSTRQSGPRPAVITVRFEARSPTIAAAVVNDYVTRIQTANVAGRTGQAEATLAFFQQSVDRLSSELARRSARIEEFQLENADSLPGDQEFRLQRQSLLQERIAAAERERRSLLDTRQRTIQIFEFGGTTEAALPPDQQELQQLEDQLATLLLRFSDSAPQVRQVRSRIQLLEDRIARQASQGQIPDDTAVEPLAEPVDPRLALQLAEIDARLETLDFETAETLEDLERLNEAISQSPRTGIELSRLERDYDALQLQFDNARSSLAQAAIGVELEAGGRGQRITVIEPPVVPSRPASPDRKMIAAAGVGLGLALAASFFLLLELLNRSVRRPAELVKSLGITPFATLPYVDTAWDRFVRRSIRVTAVIVVLGALSAGLWAVDQYVMPLSDLSVRVLDRLGLA